MYELVIIRGIQRTLRNLVFKLHNACYIRNASEVLSEPEFNTGKIYELSRICQ